MESDNKNKNNNIHKEFDFIVKLLFIVPGGGIIGVLIFSFIDTGPPSSEQYIYGPIVFIASMILSAGIFMAFHNRKKGKADGDGSIL